MFNKILLKLLDTIAKGCYTGTEMSDLNQIVDLLGNLTIPEALQLVRILEEKWGIKATVVPQPVTKVIPIPESNVEPDYGTLMYNVKLVGVGPNKIQVIKAMREMNPTLGLREAKEYVESLPRILVGYVGIEEANKVADAFRAVGAGVELETA